MLVVLDLHVNCRIRRLSSRVDLKPDVDALSTGEKPDAEKYAGGRLFGMKEDEHGI
jgi:hypothetical protein